MKLADSQEHHILCLNGPQQAALRYCLYNLAQQELVGYLNFLNEHPNSPLEKIGRNVCEIVRQYDTVATFLSPFQGNDTFKGKTRMLLYNTTFFKFVVKSVNIYDYSTCEIILGKDVALRINRQMKDLTETVRQSSLFTFTQEEIKKQNK